MSSLTKAQKNIIMRCCEEREFCSPLKNGRIAQSLWALEGKGLMKPSGLPGWGYQHLYELTEEGIKVRERLLKRRL